MAIWTKLKHELDRAGEAAQGALDEGRVRLEAFRARQLADKSAQTLGYAVYRARQEGRELEPDVYARLSSALAANETAAASQERRLSEIVEARRNRRTASPPPSGESAPPPRAEPEPPASATRRTTGRGSLRAPFVSASRFGAAAAVSAPRSSAAMSCTAA
jgi:hypothetical protein